MTTSWLFNNLRTSLFSNLSIEETFVQAIINKDNRTLYKLINKVNINTKIFTFRSTIGYPPLVYACIYGNLEITKILCKLGSNINEKTDENMLPIDYAMDNRHIDIVKYLLDFTIDKSSTIISIIQTKNRDLYDNIMSINFKDVNFNGTNPLLMACFSKNGVILKRILMEKINEIDINDIDISSHSALHICVIKGMLNSVKLLCNIPKININLRNSEGKTALWLAKNYKNKDIEDYLISIGAKL